MFFAAARALEDWLDIVLIASGELGFDEFVFKLGSTAIVADFSL
jgi:hypothetical protein